VPVGERDQLGRRPGANRARNCTAPGVQRTRSGDQPITLGSLVVMALVFWISALVHLDATTAALNVISIMLLTSVVRWGDVRANADRHALAQLEKLSETGD
jgi:Sodium:sulfate symporter transmembrane region